MTVIDTVEQNILLLCKKNNTTPAHIFRIANVSANKKDLNVNELLRVSQALNTKITNLL